MPETSSNVIQLFDPDAPWRGARREEAIRACRISAELLAYQAVHKVLKEIASQPACVGLGFMDALPVVAEAFRRATIFGGLGGSHA